ncbi:hypothetical protein [Pediococcus pentosaceus]|uniref:hypothetical protein n=1 Tax=Pediococcus pentosaceus TaxID=1255 RepID=UPI000C084604|nr:hypothetical protein [Pediococcus pentosaceus]
MGEPEYSHAEVVYHANTEENVEKFIGGSLIISQHPNDDYWLGEGMYFWDNKDNAVFWNKRRRDSEHTAIAKSQLAYHDSDIIDMVDTSAIFKLRKQIQKICNILGLKFSQYKHKPGASLDLLARYLKMNNRETFKLVRGAAHYDRQPTYSITVDDDNIGRSHLTGKVKLMYCVRDDSLLSLRQVDE